MALIVNIKKRLGAFFLDVNFSTENETMALLGSSGCGKSMTLKCIAGIETPDEGYIELDGRVLFDSKRNINLSVQERRVGYLFQQYALFPNMTVWQNIMVGVWDKEHKKAIVEEKIKALKLGGLEHKYPSELSGGQQQRVALARILVNGPQVLLLDEPFSALDSYLKWQLGLELAELLNQFAIPTIFVSHSRDEVYSLCESVCVLNSGKSELKTPVHQLFDNPKTVAACLLSGCKNFSNIEKLGSSKIMATDWGVELNTKDEVTDNIASIGVQAHHIKIASNLDGENCFECTVEKVINNIFSNTLVVSTPAGENGKSRICIEISKEQGVCPKIKDNVFVSIGKENIIILEASKK